MLHATPSNVRPAAVAGAFYPGASDALHATVDRLVATEPAQLVVPPKALIVPHAGYRYSGPIAAAAYRTLRHADAIRRVVLIGPAHRVALRGIALPGADVFATPLGRVPLDLDAIADLRTVPNVVVDALAHEEEHSLEVQLPFLQRMLRDFALVPLLVGRASPDEVAQVLERIWGDERTLIVASSDLSHYLRYSDAQAIDARTIDRVMRLGSDLGFDEACGAGPINGLLRLARTKGLVPTLLDLRNSGDTSGDRSRVVGYAAVAFSDPRPGGALLAYARQAIESEFAASDAVPDAATQADGWLRRPIGCFVTLRSNSELRGCVGAIEPEGPLIEEIRRNARAAAFRDPRFDPLTRAELPGVGIELSLLTAPEPIVALTEGAALAALRVGIDGVALRAGDHHATFLPQVWRQVATPRDFMRQLKTKAGLQADSWPADLRIMRYRAQSWSE